MNDTNYWKKINECRHRSAEKYTFFFGNYSFSDFGKGKIAKKLPRSTVGWGSRAVEMRSNKTTFDCFENDDLHFTDIARRYGIFEALEKIKEDDVFFWNCCLDSDSVLFRFTAKNRNP